MTGFESTSIRLTDFCFLQTEDLERSCTYRTSNPLVFALHEWCQVCFFVCFCLRGSHSFVMFLQVGHGREGWRFGRRKERTPKTLPVLWRTIKNDGLWCVRLKKVVLAREGVVWPLCLNLRGREFLGDLRRDRVDWDFGFRCKRTFFHTLFILSPE